MQGEIDPIVSSVIVSFNGPLEELAPGIMRMEASGYSHKKNGKVTYS